jgi:hypothetical protein
VSWRFARQLADNRNSGRLRFEKPSFDGNIESTWLLVNDSQATIPALFGVLESSFKLESLILAQNERWRQA